MPQWIIIKPIKTAGGIAWVECMYRHRCSDVRFEDLVQWTMDQSRSGSLSKLLAELVTAECENLFLVPKIQLYSYIIVVTSIIPG